MDANDILLAWVQGPRIWCFSTNFFNLQGKANKNSILSPGDLNQTYFAISVFQISENTDKMVQKVKRFKQLKKFDENGQASKKVEKG